jgi:di/tricarboxylate transporter
VKHNDDKLRSLLKQWRDIEPQTNFEADVWRRIRVTADQRTERVSLIDMIGRLLWKPAWSVAAALFMAAIVGVWGGVASTSRPADPSRTELQFMAPGTLAGSYLQGTAKESQ